MKKQTLYTIFLILLVSGLSSCLKDIRELNEVESLSYDPSFSVPIGSLDYLLEDIMPPDSLFDYEIPDSLIQAGNLDTMILLYNDDLLFFQPPVGYTACFREPVNFSNLSPQMENLRSAMLKTIIRNSLPLSIEVQGYLLGNNEQIIDSLISTGRMEIPAPLTDENGVVAEPAEATIYAHYNSDKTDALMDVNEILIYMHLDTYVEDRDTLRVYSWNGLELEIGLRADLTIPVNP